MHGDEDHRARRKGESKGKKRLHMHDEQCSQKSAERLYQSRRLPDEETFEPAAAFCAHRQGDRRALRKILQRDPDGNGHHAEHPFRRVTLRVQRAESDAYGQTFREIVQCDRKDQHRDSIGRMRFARLLPFCAVLQAGNCEI